MRDGALPAGNSRTFHKSKTRFDFTNLPMEFLYMSQFQNSFTFHKTENFLYIPQTRSLFTLHGYGTLSHSANFTSTFHKREKGDAVTEYSRQCHTVSVHSLHLLLRGKETRNPPGETRGGDPQPSLIKSPNIVTEIANLVLALEPRLLWKRRYKKLRVKLRSRGRNAARANPTTVRNPRSVIRP